MSINKIHYSGCWRASIEATEPLGMSLTCLSANGHYLLGQQLLSTFLVTCLPCRCWFSSVMPNAAVVLYYFIWHVEEIGLFELVL
jgi:hypothetical protein